MRLLHLNEYVPNRKSILFLNGGGQITFAARSKVVRFFKKFPYNLIAVELPGHGESSFNQILTETEYLDHFKKHFVDIITNQKISVSALVGFSLGGLLSLKAAEMRLFDVEYVIVWGCGFGIGKEEKPKFEYYTSAQFFIDMGWEQIMRRNHRKGWFYLLHTIPNLMKFESPIFSDPKNIDSRTNVLLIIGDKEELFTEEFNRELIPKDKKNIEILRISNTAHFDYTSKSWDEFSEKITEVFNRKNWFVK